MMNKISEKVKRDKNIAMAIVIQAIIDEGAIGADGSIVITYTSKNNASYLWEIANAWNLVHPLRTKKYITHTKWCVSFKAEKRKEIYNFAGQLPDPRQDKMFRHILRHYKGGAQKGHRGVTKIKVLKLLKKKAMTVRDLSYALNISASSTRKHLRKLKEERRIFVKGFNKDSSYKNQRTAQIWAFYEPEH